MLSSLHLIISYDSQSAYFRSGWGWSVTFSPISQLSVTISAHFSVMNKFCKSRISVARQKKASFWSILSYRLNLLRFTRNICWYNSSKHCTCFAWRWANGDHWLQRRLGSYRPANLGKGKMWLSAVCRSKIKPGQTELPKPRRAKIKSRKLYGMKQKQNDNHTICLVFLFTSRSTLYIVRSEICTCTIPLRLYTCHDWSIVRSVSHGIARFTFTWLMLNPRAHA